MKLADRIAQFRTPFVVQRGAAFTQLNNAAECAGDVAQAPIRFVLSNELTRLCAALALSKGARTLACADLVRVPARTVWVEWCNEAWQQELLRYGFAIDRAAPGGRRGALMHATPDGRRGTLRTFWSGEAAGDVLASSVEAYFDLDTPEGEEPAVPAGWSPSPRRVADDTADDILERCFRFRYERTWSDYYREARLAPRESEVVWRHALGTIAIDIPVVLAFFLLLGTRSGLPQLPQSFERLNRTRAKSGKAALLDHIDVRAPLVPGYASDSASRWAGNRRSPRLHHVRGHLVRRGSELFWRVPHLRGNARQGTVQSRTVTWIFDRMHHPAPH
jgi:hypothetical protein